MLNQNPRPNNHHQVVGLQFSLNNNPDHPSTSWSSRHVKTMVMSFKPGLPKNQTVTRICSGARLFGMSCQEAPVKESEIKGKRRHPLIVRDQPELTPRATPGASVEHRAQRCPTGV